MSWRLERGANVGADGAVTFTVWAPRRRALSVRVLDAAGATRAELPMTRDADGVFTARAAAAIAPVGSDYVYLLPDVGARPDPVSRHQPNGVHAPSRIVAADAFRLDRRGLARRAARRPRRLRAARRDLLARRDVRRRGRAAAVPARPGRHRRRADARGGVPGRAQLGLRRRLPVRAAHRLRRAGGPEAAGRRVPRPRARADPRRRLQPPRAGGELPRRLRPVLHRPLPHALGRRAQLRRARQRPGAAVLRRQRALLADRVPRRRPAPGRDPRHLRLRRAPDPAEIADAFHAEAARLGRAAPG